MVVQKALQRAKTTVVQMAAMLAAEWVLQSADQKAAPMADQMDLPKA
jgi:hypothetical protein